MEGMEEKLGAILGNPQLMQQIMTMANSLSPPQQETRPPEPDPGEFDPAMLQKIMGFAGQLRTDPHQRALLQALQPYLTANRLQKLERAMRAAKLANLASTAFSSGALSFLTGR